jgi:hypothetical protein
VRNSGGNNNKRILMINPHAAQSTSNGISDLILPADTVANKLVVSVHIYEPISFVYGNQTTWSSSNPSDVAAFTVPMDRVYDKFVSRGIPVIIGEFGAGDYNNEDARAAWAEYYVDYAWKIGIKCIVWDGALFNRSTKTFPFPKVLAALMKGTTGTPPPAIPPGGRGVIFKPNVYDSGDGQGSVAHGYKAQFPLSELLGSGIQVTSGNTFTLTYTFTSNVAIGNLRVILVDGSPPSYWRELSGYVDIGAVTVGTPVTGTKTITATANDSSNEANQFVLDIPETPGAASAPTLTFTTLTLVKN